MAGARATCCLAVTLMSTLIHPVAADLPLLGAADYELFNTGGYGTRPNQTFHSSNVLAPRILVNHWDRSKCSPEGFIFITLRLDMQTIPMMFSASDLSLVYSGTNHEHSTDFRPQQYKGQTYLTYAHGASPFEEASSGMILDSQYNVVDEIHPEINPDSADTHEFRFTPEGGVLMVVHREYKVQHATAPEKQVRVKDVGFAEIDIETKKETFRWMASDHLSIWDSCSEPLPNRKTGEAEFDWFHANTVSKTREGHYLVNGRAWCAMLLINGTSGDVIWQLGGKSSSFRDLSGGLASTFVGEHMAVFTDEEETEIILFNNNYISNAQMAVLSSPGCTTNCSSVMKVRLNYENMTVKLLSQWFHPDGVRARARGGAYQLPNENVLVSWGAVPAFTEFTPSGEVAMNIQVAAWEESARGTSGLYRAFKFDYKATPHWDPSIALVDGKVYVSWNGATEVDRWVLFGGMSESAMEEMKSLERQGFETEFDVGHLPFLVRVEARDINNTTLRSTRTIETFPIL